MSAARPELDVTSVPTSDPLVGRVLQDRYEILHQIGEGGMGAVYAARHLLIGNKVAVKVLHAHYAHDPRVVERFRREAQATTRIGHHHIVSVFDFGQLEDGSLYLVMEHLDGRDFALDIENGGPQRIGKVIRVLSQVCDALGAAHAAGVIHRDIKPENIFLVERDGDRDFVKVLDFGISKINEESSLSPKMTKTGVAIGTPHYMAPEQLQGGEVDERADIYAMGVMLYYALTGRHPFVAKNIAALAVEVLTMPVPQLKAYRPDLPAELQSVLDRMMAKDPADRFATTAEVKEALRPFANFEDRPEPLAPQAGAETQPVSGARTGIRVSERRRSMRAVWIALGLSMAFAAIAGAYFGLRSESEPQPPPEPAAVAQPEAEEPPASPEEPPELQVPAIVPEQADVAAPPPSEPSLAETQMDEPPSAEVQTEEVPPEPPRKTTRPPRRTNRPPREPRGSSTPSPAPRPESPAPSRPSTGANNAPILR